MRRKDPDQPLLNISTTTTVSAQLLPKGTRSVSLQFIKGNTDVGLGGAARGGRSGGQSADVSVCGSLRLLQAWRRCSAASVF